MVATEVQRLRKEGMDEAATQALLGLSDAELFAAWSISDSNLDREPLGSYLVTHIDQIAWAMRQARAPLPGWRRTRSYRAR